MKSKIHSAKFATALAVVALAVPLSLGHADTTEAKGRKNRPVPTQPAPTTTAPTPTTQPAPTTTAPTGDAQVGSATVIDIPAPFVVNGRLITSGTTFSNNLGTLQSGERKVIDVTLPDPGGRGGYTIATSADTQPSRDSLIQVWIDGVRQPDLVPVSNTYGNGYNSFWNQTTIDLPEGSHQLVLEAVKLSTPVVVISLTQRNPYGT